MGRNCNHIPEEVVEEILLRLPVKYLLRFKRVCKSWFTLISSRSFAYKHVSYNKKSSPSSSTSLFLNHTDLISFQEVAGLITISNNNDDDKHDKGDSLSCAFEGLNLSDIFELDHTTRLKGCHCDGIISITLLKDRTTVFYNPALRDLKYLPTSLVPKEYEVGAVGFGYDSKVNDYKFVMISRKFHTDEYIAELYTLGSDSWKQMKLELEYGAQFQTWGSGVYSKGVYFWWVPRWKPVQTILAFDMSNDEFHNIPLPDPMQLENKLLCLKVVLWNESVTLILTPGEFGTFEFWVMDDYKRGGGGGGVEATVSWAKRLTIGPLDRLNWPSLFWKHDELILIRDDRLPESYNLRTQKRRNLSFRECKPAFLWSFNFYVPSLVPVNRGN